MKEPTTMKMQSRYLRFILLTAAVSVVAGAGRLTGSTLDSIRASRSHRALEISLLGSGLERFSTFDLTDPPRLVVDLDGALKGDVDATYSILDSVVQQVRVGQFREEPNPVARVVFDLGKPARHSVSRRADGIHVAFLAMSDSASDSLPAPVTDQSAAPLATGDAVVVERKRGSGTGPFLSPKLIGSHVSLGRAVEVTLDHDPDIWFARENLRFAEGSFLDARGAFDPSLQVGFELKFDRAELLPAAFGGQKRRRLTFFLLATEFQKAADELQAQLDASPDTLAFFDCDKVSGDNIIREGNTIVITDTTTGEKFVIRCPTAEEKRRASIFEELLKLQIERETDPEKKKQLEEDLAAAFNSNREVVQQTIDALNLVARAARFAQRGVGETAEIEERLTGSLEIGYRVPFRSGLAVTPSFFLEGVEDQLFTKSNTTFTGGKFIVPKFTSAIGFVIDMPLGRGSGASILGPERAADLGRQSSQLDLRHAMASNALGTVTRYWNLVAAQKNLVILEDSLGRQRSVLESANALFQGEEITKTDVLQIQARVSEVSGGVFGARQALLEARLALAREMGAEVERESDAPLAADDFPVIVDPATIEAQSREVLRREAIANRNDIGAAYHRDEASRVLLETARANLRRPLDLQLTFGYTGLNEDTNMIEGIGGALDEWVGPSVSLTVSFEFPVNNSVALGQFAQANAISRQSSISKGNLQRLVGSRVVEVLASLSEAAALVRRFEAALDYQQRTVGAEYERFRGGESTAIDTVFTEEQLTGTLLSLVAARRDYASLLARLRFEMGVLVSYDDQLNGVVNPASLMVLPFSSK